jgi:hypothetical protein
LTLHCSAVVFALQRCGVCSAAAGFALQQREK